MPGPVVELMCRIAAEKSMTFEQVCAADPVVLDTYITYEGG